MANHYRNNICKSADVYYGRGDAILSEREKIKKMTLKQKENKIPDTETTPHHVKTKDFLI